MRLLAAAAVCLAPVALTFAATWIVLVVSRRRGHLDVPNERSSHVRPTPRSGGLGIVVGMLTVLLLTNAAEEHPSPAPPDATRWIGLAIGLALACVVGFVDDLRGLSPRVKFALFFAAAAAAFAPDSLTTVHGVPFAGDVPLGWAVWPLGLLWFSCYPQGFNFMDGIDGIAALTAAVSAAFLVCAAVAAGAHGLGFAAAAVGLAALGFLPLNFPKARIFMGDAGSLPLGLALAWCAAEANASGALSFPAALLLLGPFIFDVAFTLVRRAARGARLGEAHREHLYQRLSRHWNSHARVSILYAGFSVVTGCLALKYDSLSEPGKLLSLVVPLAALLAFAVLVLRAELSKGG